MKDEKLDVDAMPTSRGSLWRMGMSVLRYHKIDKRKNNIAIRFFRCAIQATDSTFTGCTAKIKAAKKPPGIDNFRKISQINSDSTTCKIRLLR